MELRQFIYLDDLAIQTLLASYNIAAPESVRESRESISEGSGGLDFKAGMNLPSIAELKLGANASGSKTAKEIFEAEKRINDQYLFSILHDALEDSGEIVDLTESDGDISFSNGDMVKIRGEAKTDPIYRFLSELSIVSDLDVVDAEENNLDEIDGFRELMYADQVGLSLEVDDTISSFGMSLNRENLWVDENREFLGRREYVVVGRIRETFGRDTKWDFADILRLADTITTDETMEEIRQLASAFVESIGDLSQEYERPDMDEVSLEELSEEDYEKEESMFELDIGDNEIALEGPGHVVHPVAIYW
ncbi:hypothetical protein [Haloarcula sp. JP-L23]|uniref:DUF6414 family protein n=1 Tax=Haloarcula sp. JP-L23 TaxID=2716717 RepID=UPI00140EA5B4|nr:hypothetical protein G9465_24385 [Haloarcula sp. JP-L23]